jgi:hypothetical protein
MTFSGFREAARAQIMAEVLCQMDENWSALCARVDFRDKHEDRTIDALAARNSKVRALALEAIKG